MEQNLCQTLESEKRPRVEAARTAHRQDSETPEQRDLRSIERSSRATARNTRSRILTAAGFLTAFALWRVWAVADKNLAIAAEVASHINPVEAFFGFWIAYPGYLVGLGLASMAVSAGRQVDPDKPWWGIAIIGVVAIVTIRAGGRSQDPWATALWLPFVAFLLTLCWTWVWYRTSDNLNKRKRDTRDGLWRLCVMAALSALVYITVQAVMPYQSLFQDDRPWQPIERVIYKGADGQTSTMTGAFLASDNVANTYLQLEPRHVVWIRIGDVVSRQLCDRRGEKCQSGDPTPPPDAFNPTGAARHSGQS
jgi:hypothetical protein